MLIIVATTMYQRESILDYLAIINELMLAKAIFGIRSMNLIKQQKNGKSKINKIKSSYYNCINEFFKAIHQHALSCWL
jgi:hypothetical protein